jgi:MoxR-like ATPase
MPAATTTARAVAVLDEIERVVVGKRSALTLILTTVLARGHVLIEDLPGLGKTLIARSFAATLGLDFTRVQFTPDLLPADLLGSTIYDMQSGRFEFRPGPIFTNLLLADEINRTPPKTQAALLEAMAEGSQHRRHHTGC